MPTLSAQDIEILMRRAGFPDSELATGVKVALAESGGDTMSHNTNAGTGDNSYGLFQINMLGDMGPDRRKKFGIKDNKELFDPMVNTRAALIIWRESGWNAWSTYKTGKYKGGLDKAAEGAKGLAESVPQVQNPITGVTDAVNNFGTTIMRGFTNFGGIVAALAFLGIGIILLIRTSDTVKSTVDKTVGIVAGINPAGKAAKAARTVKRVL